MRNRDSMASHQHGQDAQNNGRGMPLNIITSQPAAQQRRGGGRGNSRDRFSWLETPVEMQEPQIRAPVHQPMESPIPQSPPDTPGFPQKPTIPQPQPQPQLEAQSRPAHQVIPPRSTSPYGLPAPAQTHPAYFAPVVSEQEAAAPHSRPGSVPLPSPSPAAGPDSNPQRASTQKPLQDDGVTKKLPLEPDHAPVHPSYSFQRQTTQPIFSPSSFAGPNGPSPESHQPGQVPHPNMDLSAPGSKAAWIHGLCECSTDVGTCMTGLFCPCVLDSRTAYRMAAKSEHRDPTDLLSFDAMNGRCITTAVFGVCGLFCILPLTLRTRIRHTYRLTGNFGSDVLESCCCCCCVVIQNEREVRDREDRLRVWAGPAHGTTLAGGACFERRTTGMMYTPGGA